MLYQQGFYFSIVHLLSLIHIYYNIGVCLIKLREYNNAIDMLKKAVSITPESKYIFNLGYCYAMQEITSKALYFFNLAWSLDPSDKECEKAVNLLLSKRCV